MNHNNNKEEHENEGEDEVDHISFSEEGSDQNYTTN